MSDTTLDAHTWVAFGPAGAVGSIHAAEGGYTFLLMDDDAARASYPTLAVAKSALHAALGPGSEWPDFKEH